jgi:hypothetical protein
MNLDGSEKQAACDYINPYFTNGYVYGMKLDGTKIYAVIKQAPDDEGTLYEALDVTFESKKVSVIDSLVDVINTIPEGGYHSFDFKEETILPAAAITAMKDRNITITFDLGDYSWDIKGRNVTTDNANDLNLEIKKDQGVIPENILSKVSRKNSTIVELDLQHSGVFGLTANINYMLGSQYSNNIAELYSYDREKSSMDKMDTMMVDSNGSLQLDLDEASCYALVLNNTYAHYEPEITTAAPVTTASTVVTTPAVTTPATVQTTTVITKAPAVTTTVTEETTPAKTTPVTKAVTTAKTAPVTTAVTTAKTAPVTKAVTTAKTAPVTTAITTAKTTAVTTTVKTEPATTSQTTAATTAKAAPVTTAKTTTAAPVTSAPPVTTAAEQVTKAVTTATTEPQADNTPKTGSGDIDGSGKVDLSDMTTIALYILGDLTLTDAQLKNADVTGDGLVDLRDLATFKQFLSHKIDKF